MNKHVNKVRKATGRAEAITAGRQQNKQQYLIIELMKKKESIKTAPPVERFTVHPVMLQRRPQNNINLLSGVGVPLFPAGGKLGLACHVIRIVDRLSPRPITLKSNSRNYLYKEYK